MHVIGPPGVLAPQTAGHPLGLPESHHKKLETAPIKPVKKGATTRQAQDRPTTSAELAGRDRPSELERDTEDDHKAPPTVLQLKIQEILDEQAKALENEAQEPAMQS